MKSTGISNPALPPVPPPAGLPPALFNQLAWTDLAALWPTLGVPARRHLARSAGRMLHALWSSREDLVLVPPETWSIDPEPVPRLVPPTRGRAHLPLNLTASHAEETLADWYEAGRSFTSASDRLAFARAFFDLEVIDRHGWRQALRSIHGLAARSARQLARRLQSARRAEHAEGAGAAGVWLDSSLSPDDVLAEVQRAESGPGRQVIKAGPSHILFRCRLFGRDTLVKRYGLTGPATRARYWFRLSRARRAWTAAATLRDLGLATPEPLGYVEVGCGRAPATSYFITEFLPDALSVRAWVKLRYRALDDTARRNFRRLLSRFLLDLHRSGIYHADTKALNMLIEEAPDGSVRLLWIDMDGVQPGHRPTRYQVLRNLVQLNGSVRSWVPEEDRLDFLRRIAGDFPWLRDPRIVTYLRRWTERRLRKEIRTRCGP